MSKTPAILTLKTERVRNATLDRRKHRRHPACLGGSLRLADKTLRYCDILDVSANGAQIRTARPLAQDTWVTLGIERIGKIHAQVVWRKDNLAGIQFAAEPRYVSRMLRGVLPDMRAAA